MLVFDVLAERFITHRLVFIRSTQLYLYGPGTKRVTYADFVNKELILFFNADNERSIPSIVDGKNSKGPFTFATIDAIFF